ncbi:MAG: DUF1660 family phage protein [Gelidibacter sp.]
MKKHSTAPAPMKLYCNLFGHNYQVSKKVTSHVKEYTCTCCKRQLTTNSNGDLTELTPKFKEINSTLEAMYMRRMERSQEKMLSSSVF